MKKTILGIAVAISSLTFAQEKAKSSASPVSFGVKAGLNVSSINADDSKAKAGFYGGVFANIPVATSFSVQPEVLYSGMGAKNKNYSSVKLNLDYISVPIMLQYNVLPELYLEAGPQFSFAISKKIKGDGGSVDVDNYYKGFDFGVGIGAGYYIAQGFGVTARFVAGATDIIENNPGDAIRNNVFQVGVAYKF
ncbi:MAG: PorT family protein [Chryseobacterium sp.]|uniref:porin family protein n=1 Tax=Chryseobacterium sp. TaxID=1871047 RepID=UPI000DB4233D|nr:porin family protein [Chryseobacterium sp.]MPS64442.1 PorT family protein [Chryseobacterium sp.]PZU18278.1 MAG: PorT family protein [Chryseobacterium sp.]